MDPPSHAPIPSSACTAAAPAAAAAAAAPAVAPGAPFERQQVTAVDKPAQKRVRRSLSPPPASPTQPLSPRSPLFAPRSPISPRRTAHAHRAGSAHAPANRTQGGAGSVHVGAPGPVRHTVGEAGGAAYLHPSPQAREQAHACLHAAAADGTHEYATGSRSCSPAADSRSAAAVRSSDPPGQQQPDRCSESGISCSVSQRGALDSHCVPSDNGVCCASGHTLALACAGMTARTGLPGRLLPATQRH